MNERNSLGFFDSPELESMAHFLLEQLPQEFQDAKDSRFKIFFTDKDPSERHFAGYCRKLDGATKHRTGLDYFIVIYGPAFQKYSIEEKFLVLIHELHHILLGETKKGKILYQLQKHNEEEDFCELPSHDKYSNDVYEILKTRIQRMFPELLSKPIS